MTETRIREPESDTDKIANAIENQTYIISSASVPLLWLCLTCLISILVLAGSVGFYGHYIVDRLSQGVEVAEKMDQKAHVFTVNHKPGE